MKIDKEIGTKVIKNSVAFHGAHRSRVELTFENFAETERSGRASALQLGPRGALCSPTCPTGHLSVLPSDMGGSRILDGGEGAHIDECSVSLR